MNSFSLKIVTLILLALLGFGCCEPLPQPKTPADPAEPKVLGAVAAPILSLPSELSGTVSLKFMFDAGSADDPVGKRGLTMLTASLVAGSGTGELTYSELNEKLFPTAAHIGVEYGRDTTTIGGRVHHEKLEEYYTLLRDVLLNPGMGNEDFARIKQRQLMSLTQYLRGTNDEELGKAALQWHIYPGHPYAHPEQGVEADLLSITLEEAVAHRTRTLCSSRLTIGIAGAIPDGFAQRIVEDMKKLPTNCAARAPLPQQPFLDGPRVLLVDKPTADSTAISLGFPIEVNRNHKDYAALKLIETYFGQHRTFTGKLQDAIRGLRGINYGNYAYVEHFEQEGWSKLPAVNVPRRQQYFSIWLRPVKDSQKHFTLRLALHELNKLLERGITQEELDSTRRYIKRYYLNYNQTELRKLGYALDDHFYGLQEPYFEQLFAQLDKLTPEDIKRVLDANLRSDNLTITMVTKDSTQFAEQLAANTPSPMVYGAEVVKSDEIVKEDSQVSVIKLNIKRENIEIIPANSIF